MNRSIVVAAVAIVLAWSASAGAGPLRDLLKERAERRQTTQQHSADEMEQAGDRGRQPALPSGVQVERDLAYGADPEQRLDVYRPEQARGATVILMVHGGGWVHGDKQAARFVTNKVARWVPQGQIVVSINYRMAQADVLQEADDVARALAFVQAKAAGWGGDPRHVVLIGHSAGAHLVSLLSADPSIATRQGAKPWAGTVALDSAAFDVVQIMQQRHYRLYDKPFGKDPAHWKQVSPIHRLAGPTVPMLLVCSSQRTESCGQARGFATKASGLGSRVSVRPEDRSHAQINEELGLPGAYTDAVEAFMHAVLGH